MSDEEIIANATSAAPKTVGDAAQVIEVAEDGQMRVPREGSNGFTRMADNPASPGNDPMCLDANGMRWAEAWMSQQHRPAAVEPADGDPWVETGPHVMIFNYGEAMSGYPEDTASDTAVPHVK